MIYRIKDEYSNESIISLDLLIQISDVKKEAVNFEDHKYVYCFSLRFVNERNYSVCFYYKTKINADASYKKLIDAWDKNTKETICNKH